MRIIMVLPTSSELRRVHGKEPALAGHISGRAAEVGEPTGQENSKEASATRALCTLLTTGLHEGPAQPVHEEAKSTAPHQQEQVAEQTRESISLCSQCVLFVLSYLQH